jgi:hypothetical protein
MFKRSPAYLAVAAALAAPLAAEAFEMGAIDVAVTLKNETAFFTQDGQVTGEADNMLDDSGHDTLDLMKFENSAKIFLNGDFSENSSWHAELNFIYDTEAVDDYKGHDLYSQNDYFRELYLDTEVGGWDLRLGKQQVVWGTADGIKLLDIINPTDFRELNQNSMEDSRIPVWMANLERNVGERGNIQLIVAQPKENVIPGLDSNDDVQGHPFVMKGVDTITGPVNGFYSITPALSATASVFNMFAAGGAFGPSPSGLVPFGGLTVDGFVAGPGLGATGSGTGDLNLVAQGGIDLTPLSGDPYENNYVTNLMNINGVMPTDVVWNANRPASAFEYMANATFATFNTFTGIDFNTGFITGSKVQWRTEYPDIKDPNAGFRWRSYTDGGLNYSVNYFYHYSANPTINMSWHDPNTGKELTVQRAAAGAGGMPDVTSDLSRDQAFRSTQAGAPVTILAHDGTKSTYYGAFDPRFMNGTPGAGAPTLRFTETTHRIHSIGTSFDYAMNLGDVPLVLRGEFLYDKDDRQPVIDRYLLSIGDLSNALKMEKADYFKYVIGADITVFTNLLVSGQFIQFRNLDYVDKSATCTSAFTTNSINCSRYTGDFATLSLDNGMAKAQENKEFYSLFFSKPFGESQLGRWNNITIYEEGGGWWNRFDLEYSFTDRFVATGELNLYWGEEDTTFGQFENSSNVQVGMKYIID